MAEQLLKEEFLKEEKELLYLQNLGLQRPRKTRDSEEGDRLINFSYSFYALIKPFQVFFVTWFF